MKEIPLTQGVVALVDDEDYERLVGYRWFTLRGTRAIHAARHSAERRTIYMHQDILGVRPGYQVDHVNGDGVDNRRANLRWATRTQQRHNQPCYRNSHSGLKGVQLVERTKRWRARITYGGQTRHLGTFVSPVDAARAYDARAREVFGVFARLNFPEEVYAQV